MKFLAAVIFFTIIITTYGQKEEDVIFILKGHSDFVNTVTFSIDDKFLFSGSEDRMIKQWDVETGELINEVEAHYGPVKDILCLKDGITIMSAGDKVVKTWNILLEQQDAIYSHTTYVWSFDVNPANDRMICGTYDKKIYLWNLFSQELIERLETHEKSALAVAYSPNGKYFASGSLDEKIFIWNADSLRPEKACIGHSENIYDLEFTKDNKYLISVSKDKTVKIWEVETGGHYKTLTGHTDAVMCVSIHPNNRFFVTGSVDGTIRLWDIKTGEVIYVYIEHDKPINDICFSHDGRFFATASIDNNVILWKYSLKTIVSYYFPEELENEWQKDAIFSSKGKNENRQEYQEREEKAEIKRQEIYQKYYNELLKDSE